MDSVTFNIYITLSQKMDSSGLSLPISLINLMYFKISIE